MSAMLNADGIMVSFFCREFVNNVWYIKILSPLEVQQMGKEGINVPNPIPSHRISNSGNSCDDYWCCRTVKKNQVKKCNPSSHLCRLLTNILEFGRETQKWQLMSFYRNLSCLYHPRRYIHPLVGGGIRVCG